MLSIRETIVLSVFLLASACKTTFQQWTGGGGGISELCTACVLFLNYAPSSKFALVLFLFFVVFYKKGLQVKSSSHSDQCCQIRINHSIVCITVRLLCCICAVSDL